MVKRTAGTIVAVGAVLFGATGALASGTTTPRLAYLTGGDRGSPKVVVAGASGSNPRTLASGDQPTLSPNGQSVAFAAQSGHSSLLLYSVAGKETGKFFHLKQVAVGPIAWSPDSRYIAVGLTDVNAVNKVGRSGLVIIDTETGKSSMVGHGSIEGASWAPTRDTVVFAVSKSPAFTSRSSLFTATPGSTSVHGLITGANSVNPVWGKLGIAYDRVTSRGKQKAPVDQIWLLNGTHETQITHTHPGPLVSGLGPVAVSADGTKMIADYGGQDTSIAYTVDLKTHAVKIVKVTGAGQQYVTPWGISRDGKRLLVDIGGFENTLSAGKIESVPFGGGSPTVLVAHGGVPSWNQ